MFKISVNQCCWFPHMSEWNPLFCFVVVVVITPVVYILHSLFFVTSFSFINRERTVVRHSMCVSELYCLSLTSTTYHFMCNDTHTHTHTTHIKRYNSLDEGSILRRQFCLKKSPLSQETSMLPWGFEPAIWTSEQTLTLKLDRAATGISKYNTYGSIVVFVLVTWILLDYYCEYTLRNRRQSVLL
jgi:hypothetical protein